MHSNKRVQKTWGILLGLWFLVLSGVLSQPLKTPGLLQVWQLSHFSADRTETIERLQAEVEALNTDASALLKDPTVQEREARRVLGYVAPDEIVFDFTEP
jgi:cell division protein FtsB